jgi:hypothetical protein
MKFVLLPGVVFNGGYLYVDFLEGVSLEPIPGLNLALDKVGDI